MQLKIATQAQIITTLKIELNAERIIQFNFEQSLFDLRNILC